MKTYCVYFDQVNQSKVEVKAKDREEAIRKARLLWRQTHSEPYLRGVEGPEGYGKVGR